MHVFNEVDEALFANNQRQIDERGYAVVSVTCKWGKHPIQLIFSAGLSLHGLDEVVMFGPPNKEPWMAGMLSGFCKVLIANGKMVYGTAEAGNPEFFAKVGGESADSRVVIAPVNKFPLEVMQKCIEHANNGNQEYQLAQVVWGENGVYPFDDGWEKEDWHQPLLICRMTPEEYAEGERNQSVRKQIH